MDWGLSPASSVSVTAAERVPVAIRANCTVTEQAPFGASELPQVLDSTKSPGFVPASAMLLILRVRFPVFVTVTLCEVLVLPTSCPVKVRLFDERLAAE